jgi:uncharacterized protein YgbK (DUF1537 family)
VRVAIVADDLTGAADSAAPFAARGLSTVVALSPDAVTEADVVAIDTDSRAAPAPERVAEAFRALRADMLVKKVDSTLRGHVAVEIDAALEATGAAAVVAPAFPAMRRVIRGGRLVVDGRDMADAAALCGRPVRDAETDEDLATIVREGLGGRVLWVGSAGLTHALAAVFAAAPAPAFPTGSPVLVVAGSPSPVTRDQVRVVEEAGVACGDDAAAALARGQDAVVADPFAGAALAGLAGALILTGGATARAVLTALGAQRLRILGAPAPGLAAGLAGEVPVVLKAGGFGSPRTLLEAMRRLRR